MATLDKLMLLLILASNWQLWLYRVDVRVLYSLADHDESVTKLVRLIEGLPLSFAGGLQFKAAVEDIRNLQGVLLCSHRVCPPFRKMMLASKQLELHCQP